MAKTTAHGSKLMLKTVGHNPQFAFRSDGVVLWKPIKGDTWKIHSKGVPIGRFRVMCQSRGLEVEYV